MKPLLIAAVLSFSVFATAQAAAPDARQIVHELYQQGIAKGDQQVVRKWVAEKYIQHNPQVEDGRAGLLKLLDQIHDPANPFKVDIKRTLVDGPLVVTHSELTWGKNRQVAFDVFRVENGQVLEHWDALQVHPEKTASGHSMIDGVTEVRDQARTDSNKALVREFMQTILFDGKLDQLPRFFDGDRYIQHNPAVADGLSGLGAGLKAMAEQGITLKYQRLHRVIGQGNFVLVQSEGEFAGKPSAYYDLFRVENGKIAEHWDVIQTIPAKSANGRGMF